MLESLVIENYAIARKVSLNLQKGMSAITGETGAGKSIAIDALNLLLGGRSDARAVRPGAASASICGTFSLSDAPRALAFLRDNSLLQEDQELCIIRRSIAAGGHSRNYINDYAVSVKMLKELAPFLLNIHGQNDGQLMLKSERQMAFLDAFSGLGPEVSDVGSLYHTFRDGKNRLIELARKQDETLAEYKLTHYQIAELEKFNPVENEFTEISNEYDRLSNVKVIGDGTQEILNALNDDDTGVLALTGTLSARLVAPSSHRSLDWTKIFSPKSCIRLRIFLLIHTSDISPYPSKSTLGMLSASGSPFGFALVTVTKTAKSYLF